MTTIETEARALHQRAHKALAVMISVERHLLAEQADAIAGPMESTSAPRETRPVERDVDDDGVVDVGHSDPVPTQAARLGYYAGRARQIRRALKSIDQAFDHLEQLTRSVLSQQPDPTLFDGPRCPGWNVELRARLGGCGKVPEVYQRSDGTEGQRELCVGCRKAKYRAERDAEHEVA